MSKASRLSTEIAARQGVAQLELIHAADQLGNQVDRAIREVWGKLLREFERPMPGWQMRAWFLFQELLGGAKRELHSGLTGLAQGGHAAAATVVAQSLPIKALASPKVKLAPTGFTGLAAFEAADRRRIGKSRPILIVARRTKQAINKRHLPLVRLPKPRGVTLGRSEQRQRDQLQEMLFPAPSPSKVEGYLRRPAFGRTWEQDLSQASSLEGFDPTALINRMASAFSRGDTPQQIAKEIAPAVQGVSKVAKRVARTYGMQVSHAASREAHEQLGDMLLGYQIHAQLDTNTRPWHAARSGTIYYREPARDQKGYYQMPNPPLEADDPAERPGDAPKMAWRCRCWLSPVLRGLEALVDDPVFATAQDDLIADPVVFSDWFDQADERKRKLAVGAKSYALLQERGGAGSVPRWEQFVEPRTGTLLSTEALRNETPAQAWERTQEMRRLVDQRRYQTRQVLTFGGI